MLPNNIDLTRTYPQGGLPRWMRRQLAHRRSTSRPPKPHSLRVQLQGLRGREKMLALVQRGLRINARKTGMKTLVRAVKRAAADLLP